MNGTSGTASAIATGDFHTCAGILDGVAALARRMEGGEHDLHLAPALRRTDAWGEARAGQLDTDHRQQREVLAHCLAAVQDERRPARVVARTLVDLAQLLRDDVEQEERFLLDERVLRDDVVSIEVETG